MVLPIYCPSKKLARQSLFTFSFVQLLNIYFFSKSFLIPFNQCLGASYLTLGAGLVVKASCCQIILYILHFARFPIVIFKFNFTISRFGNFLRMYCLNDSILNISHILPNQQSSQLFSDKPNKTMLNFFSCRKVSNILPMQYLRNSFRLIFFISDLIRDEKICILLSTYFSTLMRSNMVLTSDLLWM